MNLCNGSCPSLLPAAQEASELLMDQAQNSPLLSLVGPCWSCRPEHRPWVYGPRCLAFWAGLEVLSLWDKCCWIVPFVPPPGKAEAVSEGTGHSPGLRPSPVDHPG